MSEAADSLAVRAAPPTLSGKQRARPPDMRAANERETMSDNAAAAFNTRQIGHLPAILGFDWSEVRSGYAKGRFEIGHQHQAPNGYLHAGAVVALADTACGYGCIMSLPEGAANFTTAELKANFIGTAPKGHLSCEARLVHGGRTTQVWDAEVKSEESGKTIALFRCTQIILYQPRSA
jgi:1,4-dihydroxy-2-naphthoyl-CoA hydrolase